MQRWSRASLVALSCAGLLAGHVACTTEDAAGPPEQASVASAASALVGVTLQGRSISIDSVGPADDEIEVRTPATGAPSVAWELFAEGRVVASGAAADPRSATHESFGKDGKISAKPFTAATGILQLIVPNTGGELIVRDAAGEIGRAALSPFTAGATSAATKSAIANPTKIIDNGRCGGHINILVVPEGFTEAEMPKFHAAAERIARGLQDVTGWGEHWNLINVWRQDVPSKESGISDPPMVKDTAFGVRYGDESKGEIRRAAVFDSAKATRKLTDAIRFMKATSVFVLVNSSDPNIGVSYNGTPFLIQSMSFDAIETLGHELVHNILDAADEYTDDPDVCAANLAPPRTTAYNVSYSATNPPWRSFYKAPPVEGALGCNTKVYRSHEQCLMHGYSEEMCPVCKHRMKEFFDGRAARSKTNPPAVCRKYPDAGPPPPKDCNSGGPACAEGTACTWNGDGFCCKTPWVGSEDERCATSQECMERNSDAAPGSWICAGGYCTQPDREACVDRPAVPSCLDDDKRRCDRITSSEPLHCTRSGRDAHCCARPMTSDAGACFSDDDCKSAGEICVQLRKTQGDGGALFACMKPADVRCAPAE